MRAAAARVVFGAAGRWATQPVTAPLTAMKSKAAAGSGTRTASGLPGSAKGAEGDDIELDGAMSAATVTTASRTSPRTVSGSASSVNSTTSRPSEPSTWALATPGIRRTGSSTTAAYSSPGGKGRAGEPLAEPPNPTTRPVVSATD